MVINIKNFKLLKLSIVFVLVAALMYSNFGAALANNNLDDTQNSGLSIEEYARIYARYVSDGDEGEYERILSQLTAFDQVTITFDQGSDKVSTDIQPTILRGNYIISAVASPPMYDKSGNLIGIVQNIGNLDGAPDGKYTHLQTTGWSNDDNDPYSGEAITNGDLWGWYTGSIRTKVYTDQPSWDNYLIAAYSTASGWVYLPIMKITVGSSNPITITYSYTSTAFNHISFTCCTPAASPKPYSPLVRNSIYVDYGEIV
jgi:hypothetical protein